MVWVILSAALGMTVGGIWLGRQWGLQTGQKRTHKALARQRAELLRQQREMRRIDEKCKGYKENLAKSQTAQEAADVLSEVNTDWNAGL